MAKFLPFIVLLVSFVAHAAAPVIWAGNSAQWLPSALQAAGVCTLNSSGVMASSSIGNFTDAGIDGIIVTGGTGSVIGSGTSLAQHIADVSHNGYLSSGDWSTFNAKQAALTIGNLTDAGTDGITVTAGTGAVIGSGTSIAQRVADTSHNGYLSSTDWNTFNGKQAVISMGAFSGSSSTTGATFSGSTLTMTPADVSNPGEVSASSQSFAGKKTFAAGLDAGSNQITSVTDPTTAQMAATKNYVDTQLAQLNPLAAVYAASTANIVGTYTNAVGGVCIGDTFTVTATGALSLDGTNPPLGARVLLKNQTSSFQGGVWTVTVVGTTGVSPVLTRALDFDSSADISSGQIIPVVNGTVNAGSSWYQTATVTTCSSDSQTWSQFTKPSSAYLQVANNLSDVGTKATAFNNVSPMSALGDIEYENSTPSGARLAGNITSTKNFLTQTGTGSVSAAPAWGTIAGADLPSPFTSGTASGNTSKFATTTGTLTSTHCVKIDASGNLIDAGAICGTGGSAPGTNIWVGGGNGYGSNGSFASCARFVNIRSNNGGADITYTDSSTNGAQFTVNTTGTYAVQVTRVAATQVDNIAIVVNYTGGNINPLSTTYAQGLRIGPSNTATSTGTMSVSGVIYLTAGDIVQTISNSDTNTNTNDGNVSFAITRIN